MASLTLGASSPKASPAMNSPSRFDTEEQKENISRKPLPHIPIPSTRAHGAPMSPVLVNVNPQNWPPEASSATIEGGSEGTHSRETSTDYEVGQHEVLGSRMPTTQELPYRAASSPKAVSEVNKTTESPIMMSPAKMESRSHSGPPHERRVPSLPNSLGGSDVSSEIEQVPQLQYHHQSHSENGGPKAPVSSSTYPPMTNPAEAGASVNRHLTPNSQFPRRVASAQRPISTYSEMAPRGRSPGLPGSPSWGGRALSVHSRTSPDGRPNSYVDLTNVSYPQPPPAPISLDNSQLRTAVGSNASLLSSTKTLEMYRKNVKKLHDSESQYAFAMFLVQAAQEAGLSYDGEGPQKTRKASAKAKRDLDGPYSEGAPTDPHELLREAKSILQRLSDRGYPFAQYYLADGYASGFFNKGKEDHSAAFPLFMSASKHGHAESGYRAALCYEFGWGTRKDPAKAVQFYRQAASKNHPGAMTRLGRACLSGDLGLDRQKEGLKWLRLATEAADPQYNAAPYHLGLLYETGYGDDIFHDETYAAQLFTQAADLGHVEASYRLGDAYEHGKLSCPRDPALSVHFYTGAAQQGHAAAMMALCAWYMVGAEPVLPKDENEAYEWARQAAELGLYLLYFLPRLSS